MARSGSYTVIVDILPIHCVAGLNLKVYFLKLVLDERKKCCKKIDVNCQLLILLSKRMYFHELSQNYLLIH